MPEYRSSHSKRVGGRKTYPRPILPVCLRLKSPGFAHAGLPGDRTVSIAEIVTTSGSARLAKGALNATEPGKWNWRRWWNC